MPRENGQIIEKPEGASVRRRDQIALPGVDREIAHLDAREVQRQRFPSSAAVVADVDGAARPREEQPRFAGVLTHDQNVLIARQALSDPGPVRAVVGRLICIRVEVVPHET